MGTPVPETSGHPGSRHLRIRAGTPAIMIVAGLTYLSIRPARTHGERTGSTEVLLRTFLSMFFFVFFKTINERVPRYRAIQPKTLTHPRRACDISINFSPYADSDTHVKRGLVRDLTEYIWTERTERVLRYRALQPQTHTYPRRAYKIS